jgi:hypothetical protein
MSFIKNYKTLRVNPRTGITEGRQDGGGVNKLFDHAKPNLNCQKYKSLACDK